MSKRAFTHDRWNYDCDGNAYIIAKSECPERENVPAWIVKTDNLDPECLNPEQNAYIAVEDVREGWCKYQVRSDWVDLHGDTVEPCGGYFVDEGASKPSNLRGWFPVWIVRCGEWY